MNGLAFDPFGEGLHEPSGFAGPGGAADQMDATPREEGGDNRGWTGQEFLSATGVKSWGRVAVRPLSLEKRCS